MRTIIMSILFGLAMSVSAQSFSDRLNSLANFTEAISKGERYNPTIVSSNENTSHPFDPNEIIDCINCGGSGRIPFGFTLQQCPLCLGSGKQTAGKYMQKIDLPDNGSYNGGYNGGSNGGSNGYNTGSQITGSNDATYHTEYYEDTCSFCHGSGRCSTCKGDGCYKNPFTSNLVNCPNCKNPGNDYRRGNGVCAHCQNGKVRKHRYVKY